MRLKEYQKRGQTPYIFHLGDHDPSGKDMTRDIEDRFELFCGFRVKVKRLALNMNQIEELQPPPNPAKLKDSRAEKYIAEFGEDSWELDALQPRFIRELLEENIKSIRDDDLWNAAVAREKIDRDRLLKTAENWNLIAPHAEHKMKLELINRVFPEGDEDLGIDMIDKLIPYREHWGRMVTLLKKDLAKKPKKKGK